MNKAPILIVYQNKKKKYVIISEEWKHFAYLRNIVHDAPLDNEICIESVDYFDSFWKFIKNEKKDTNKHIDEIIKIRNICIQFSIDLSCIVFARLQILLIKACNEFLKSPEITSITSLPQTGESWNRSDNEWFRMFENREKIRKIGLTHFLDMKSDSEDPRNQILEYLRVFYIF